MKQLFTIIFLTLVWLTPLLGHTQTVNDPHYDQQTYLQTVNMPQAWAIESGSSNVIIGVIAPGGVYKDHEDLNSRVTLKYQSDAQGLLSHGTIVAGIAGASTNNSKGIAGINWSSPVYSYDAGKIETFNWQENGFPMSEDFYVLDKSEIANRIHDARSDDVDILMAPFHIVPNDQIPSISSAEFQIYPALEPPNTVDYLQNTYENVTSLFTADQALTEYTNTMLALRSAYIDGATIVSPMPEYDGVLRGMPSNLNPDRISIAVGSTNLVGDSPYLYSASGASSSTKFVPEVDVVAPGIDVLTTLNTQTDEYDEVTTTAASSGIVGGVASLLKSKNSDLKPDDIREIMRRTADGMGAGVYDSKTGFGRVNAQAALQYLEDNTITHDVLENTTSTKIQSNQQKTLLKGAWGDLASGTYSVDVYEVTGTVNLPSRVEDVWFHAKGTTGWSAANPNFQRPFALVDIDGSNQEATFTTFIYHVKYNSVAQQIDEWHPTHIDDVEIAYTIAGDPLPSPPPPTPSVFISGPSAMDSGTTDTFTATVFSGTPPFTYQWSYRADGVPFDTIVFGNNSPTYDHTASTSATGETITVSIQDSENQQASNDKHITISQWPMMQEEETLPETFAIHQNYPNPFNPSSTVSFDLPEQADVTLEVFNMLGKKVATLVDTQMQAGRHESVFEASALSSGNYIARISARSTSGESFEQTMNMQLVK